MPITSFLLPLAKFSKFHESQRQLNYVKRVSSAAEKKSNTKTNTKKSPGKILKIS